MKLPAIAKREPLDAEAGVSRLEKIYFERNPFPALLKQPAQFWDEIFIANEAYMLERVTHPRIRRVLAYEAELHRLFLQYIEAETLQELVKGGIAAREPARTHRILQSVAEILADLHAGFFCGGPMVHNDLKSANVLVPLSSPDGAVLIDFTHSYFEGRLPPFITDKKQNPAGTAKYFAPEKWAGDYSQGFKGDVFAFGVLAYYTYTGRHPFEGDAAQIQQQIQNTPPVMPVDAGLKIPRNVLATTMLCLEKQPAHRPSMEHVARCYAEATSLFG
jgi:serine/threonine protein kinase